MNTARKLRSLHLRRNAYLDLNGVKYKKDIRKLKKNPITFLKFRKKIFTVLNEKK